MQFQNPEILYCLTLLIIPILIHLFQLQKFEKVPFTNVAFLQRILQDNRKSSQLKKWLILANRLLLFSAILFAFSQPYFSNKNTQTKQHTYIYLDNSLSTSAIGDRGNLLKNAAKNIIENANKNNTYSLLTNSNFSDNISYTTLKKELLSLHYSSKNKNIRDILLKFNTSKNIKSNTLYKYILMSDFQYYKKNMFTNVTSGFSAIKLNSSTKNNISIDSVYTTAISSENFTISIVIKNQGVKKDNVPIAIYNQKKLLSKQSFSITENDNKTIEFSLPKTALTRGKIQITFSDTFTFDNNFYFSLNSTKKINVLTIGESRLFYQKIFTKNEFNFNETSIQNLNYNTIPNQELIILNELKSIPEVLKRTLSEFTKNGGTLVIVPNQKIDINSYNSFFATHSKFKIIEVKKDSLKISKINFEHPIFKNVFSKKVNNFQYPSTNESYITSAKYINSIVEFQNNAPFIGQINSSSKNIYWVSSSLSEKITNFSKSPLIVPIFYNFGKLSFKSSELYYHLNTSKNIDIETQLGKDEILSMAKDEYSFIPQQQSYQNKVSLFLKDQIDEAGFYYVIKQKDTIKTLAFNNPKEESALTFLELNDLTKDYKSIEIYDSVAEVFNDLNKKNEVHWLWKWFLALAIVSLLAEILILKFYKP